MKGIFLNALVRKQGIEILFAFIIKTFALCRLFVQRVPIVQYIDAADGKIDATPVRAAYAVPRRRPHAGEDPFGRKR